MVYPSVRYLAPKIWDLVPDSIKYSNSSSKLKKLIKLWKPEACLCRQLKLQAYLMQLMNH